MLKKTAGIFSSVKPKKEQFIMKTRKSILILGMLSAFMAAAFTGCSDPDSKDEEKDYGNFKVECGIVDMSDYQEYQTWAFSTAEFSFDAVTEWKNTLKSKSKADSYQDLGTISTSDLRKLIINGGNPAETAESNLNAASKIGYNLIGVFHDDTGKEATWVYMEAESAGNPSIIDISGSIDTSISYKVESGILSTADYLEYQEWNTSTTEYTFDAWKAEKDVLVSKTEEGTYENKGTISATEVKAFLLQKGIESDSADASINIAARLGSHITNYFITENGKFKAGAWVYIEKASAGN